MNYEIRSADLYEVEQRKNSRTSVEWKLTGLLNDFVRLAVIVAALGAVWMLIGKALSIIGGV